MKLTDTQLVLLSAASQREDGAIELAPRLKGGAAHKVVGTLLTEGLVEEIPARGALPVWRRDDEEGALALCITPRGLAAIGVDEGGTPSQAEEPRDTEQATDLAPDKSSRRVAAAGRKKTRNEVPQRSATPGRGRSEDLDRRGVRTKVNGLADGRVRGGVRFGVGSLGHLLKNRFYIGEVLYRGEAHRAEHEPILDRDLFAAVQAKLAANAIARQVRLKGSPAILAGRIFDDRGNRMTPTHSNKLGVRYRYYVSHAIVQQRKAEAGSVARVPAPEIENVVLDGVRTHLASIGEVEHSTTLADRDLIERYVDRVIVKPQALEVRLVLASEASAETAEPGIDDPEPRRIPPTTITLAWTAPSFTDREGHRSCAFGETGDEAREPRCSAHRDRQGARMDRRHPTTWRANLDRANSAPRCAAARSSSGNRCHP